MGTVVAAAVWMPVLEALEDDAFFVAATFFATEAFQAATTFGLWMKWCSVEPNNLLVRGVPCFLACAHRTPCFNSFTLTKHWQVEQASLPVVGSELSAGRRLRAGSAHAVCNTGVDQQAMTQAVSSCMAQGGHQLAHSAIKRCDDATGQTHRELGSNSYISLCRSGPPPYSRN